MISHKLNCSVCGGEFTAKLRRACYCSTRCKSAAQRSRFKTKKCTQCGITYKPTNATQKSCSVSCGLAAAKPSRQVTCYDCKAVFTHHGRGSRKRCVVCQKINTNERSYRSSLKHGKIKNPGVGSGGAQFGEANHRWKGGDSLVYRGNYRITCFKVWDKCCVVCGDELNVEVHHIDGDGKNNVIENLIPLCHKHHWQIHSRRGLTADELMEALENIWPDCRCKIAEKTGNSGGGQPELKAKARCNA